LTAPSQKKIMGGISGRSLGTNPERFLFTDEDSSPKEKQR